MKTQYDFLIVGAGLFGAVFAREMTNKGKKCLVIDKRKHVGGNLYCELIEGINVHKYGPHIFHTNDKYIWDYVNSFVKFNHFIYSPLANFKERLFNLPFNMNTFYQLWQAKSPQEAKMIILEQVKISGILNPKNLEEQAISMVGTQIYDMFIKGYTEKQWGRNATELPPSIIKRLPVRFTYDNNYFDDKYQGIPIGGYNKLFEGLLAGIEVKTDTDFFSNRKYLCEISNYVVYTGKLDEFYDYRFGCLEYRSLRFEQEIMDIANLQGVAVINSMDSNVAYTRTIEHKHFEFGLQPRTVISKEYPEEWALGKEAYYPMPTKKNELAAKMYSGLAKLESNVIFGGRLAEYKYYDMHQVIGSALTRAKKSLPDNSYVP